MSYGVFIGLLLALGNLSEGGNLPPSLDRCLSLSSARGIITALGVCLLFALTMSVLSPAGERAAER